MSQNRVKHDKFKGYTSSDFCQQETQSVAVSLSAHQVFFWDVFESGVRVDV